MCEILEINKTRTSPLHPQSDGLVERFNRTMKKSLKKYALDNPENLDIYLPYILSAYQSSCQASTESSPNYLMFGRETNMPLSLIASVPLNKVECTDYASQLRAKLEESYDLS